MLEAELSTRDGFFLKPRHFFTKMGDCLQPAADHIQAVWEQDGLRVFIRCVSQSHKHAGNICQQQRRRQETLEGNMEPNGDATVVIMLYLCEHACRRPCSPSSSLFIRRRREPECGSRHRAANHQKYNNVYITAELKPVYDARVCCWVY